MTETPDFRVGDLVRIPSGQEATVLAVGPFSVRPKTISVIPASGQPIEVLPADCELIKRGQGPPQAQSPPWDEEPQWA